MTTGCTRCGSEECRVYLSEPPWSATDIVDCRDRELSNLQSLLRSVTLRLENARECCDGADRLAVDAIARELDAVLEMLS